MKKVYYLRLRGLMTSLVLIGLTASHVQASQPKKDEGFDFFNKKSMHSMKAVEEAMKELDIKKDDPLFKKIDAVKRAVKEWETEKDNEAFEGEIQKNKISEKEFRQIRKAYRTKSLRVHPDRKGTEDAFKKLQRAYEILGKYKENPFMFVHSHSTSSKKSDSDPGFGFGSRFGFFDLRSPEEKYKGFTKDEAFDLLKSMLDKKSKNPDFFIHYGSAFFLMNKSEDRIQELTAEQVYYTYELQ